MRRKYVSDAVVRRLPRYRRFLKNLDREGVERISSAELAEKMDLTASQIRQDLNHFGGFGQQGYGYSVSSLENELSDILGLKRKYTVAVVGCGRLGEAIANYLKNFEDGFEVVAFCDIRDEYHGKEIMGKKVMNKSEFDKFVIENPVDIAVLTVSESFISEVVDFLVSCKIKGIWNFCLTDIEVRGVAVHNVHLSDSLHRITYYINNPD